VNLTTYGSGLFWHVRVKGGSKADKEKMRGGYACVQNKEERSQHSRASCAVVDSEASTCAGLTHLVIRLNLLNG